jgi:hypothetical protein
LRKRAGALIKGGHTQTGVPAQVQKSSRSRLKPPLLNEGNINVNRMAIATAAKAAPIASLVS